MKCANVGQMKRVAQAGAMKMTEAGYSFEHLDGTEYLVHKPNGDAYFVDPVAGWCACPFHEENRHLTGTTCKHIVWVSWMREAAENRVIHQTYREIAANGGGLGLLEISGDSRLAKMFASPADDII